jgi:hypothetical protein
MRGRGAPSKSGARAPVSQTLTVRLFPNVHGMLIEEFAKVGRRRRAPRAAQLMMIGLLHERAYGYADRGLPETRVPAVASAPGVTALGIRPEDAAFVSSILDSAEG